MGLKLFAAIELSQAVIDVFANEELFSKRSRWRRSRPRLSDGRMAEKQHSIFQHQCQCH
jgi:hypothetical protein